MCSDCDTFTATMEIGLRIMSEALEDPAVRKDYHDRFNTHLWEIESTKCTVCGFDAGPIKFEVIEK